MAAQEHIAHLADVPIEINIELGRKMMTLREVLAITTGSVIRIPRSAGENIDLIAGGTLFASGEVVIIEERFGVRITDFNEED
ncbi:MAG: flagellar motor switch protein FliN [Bryobacteraceae bacterium]